MSRFDDLIRQLAPGGVPFVALGSVAHTVAGLSGKTKSDFSDGNARFVSYRNVFNNLSVDQFAPDLVKIGPGEKQNRLHMGDVVFTGSSETAVDVGMSSVVLSEPGEPLYLNSFCFAVRFDDQGLLVPGFSKYLFRSESMREQIQRAANGVTRINVSKDRFMKIRVPIPPTQVQAEVVRILDKFTELGGQLEAELASRRRQYHHYRDQLLNFPEEIEWVELQQLFVTRNGYTPSKSDASLWADGTVPWFRMEDIRANGHVLASAIQRIPQAAVKGGRLFPANSILVATSATIGEHALITVPHLSNQRFTSLTVKPEFADRLDMKFVHHYCFVLDEWCRTNTTVSSFASVDMAAFRAFRFPVPALEEQRRIGAILDKFDALVNDPSVGIPAEIRARRKQYEYYRDKLLTFPEAAA